MNSGRAGAANLDVIQEVEYVKADSKIVYLLECLQKTSPPVVIFSARTKEGKACSFLSFFFVFFVFPFFGI